MADDTTAAVIPLHQVPLKKRDRTPAQRAKAGRPRKKQKPMADSAAEPELASSEQLIPPEFLTADGKMVEPPVTQPLIEAAPQDEPITRSPVATSSLVEPVAASRLGLAPAILSIAAFALGAVGITINGWFARSLGASDVAGWLFLAVGVAADLVALVMPSCAAGLWQAGQRTTALVGWAAWLMTFVFAVTAGIGFASTNISDVTLARASRVTPAVTTAQAALNDAMAARDRECKGGVGKFCREAADPQTDAAIKLVTWISGGLLRPKPEDFAMLRLILLALLPQIGGILLLVGRRSASYPSVSLFNSSPDISRR
jgi:hypothetical protein